MRRYGKFTKEQKIQAILNYKEGVKTISVIMNELKIADDTFYTWVRNYDNYGEQAFEHKTNNRSYTKEFKEKVVKDYISGLGSYADMAKKYKITAKSIIINWVKEYNNSGTLKDYDPKSEVYTMKARKTTYEERVEIVNYCISHDNDYKGTAEKYIIPYSLVYQWVAKYNKDGYEVLKYQKKGPKSKEEIIPTTPEEKLKLEFEKLKRENERLKFENEVLKKKKYFEKHLN